MIGSLAHSLRAGLTEGRGDYLFSECVVAERRIILAVPSTYMNESGVAVAQLCEHFSLSPSGLVIVYDDFQLPLGMLRIRAEGSDGGHHGLASVIEHLQTENIPRLRVGIAGATCPSEDRKELMASYVLSPFEEDEVKLAAKLTDHAGDALMAFIQHGIQFAMTNFNKAYPTAGSETGELRK